MSDKYDKQAIDLARDIYRRITLSSRNDAHEAAREAKFVGDVAPTIAAALRQTADDERAECIKIAEMYVLGDDVNLLDPMAVRQDQIASNIVKAIRASGRR